MQKLSNETRHRVERDSLAILAILVSSTFYDHFIRRLFVRENKTRWTVNRRDSSLFFFIQTNLSTLVEETTVEKTLLEESTPPSHDSCLPFETLLHLAFNFSSTIFLLLFLIFSQFPLCSHGLECRFIRVFLNS